MTPKASVELKEEDVFDLPRASPLRAPAAGLEETTSRTSQRQGSSRKGRANSVLMQSRSNAQLDWLRRYQARRLQQQARQETAKAEISQAKEQFLRTNIHGVAFLKRDINLVHPKDV